MSLTTLRMAAAAGMLAVAGCSDERDAEVSEQALAEPPAARSSLPAAEISPADAERRYIGRWASRADLCEGGAWVFQRDSFGMEDGPMCDFSEVSEIPGGYRIEAQCEKPREQPRETTFTVRFADTARAMTVTGLSTLPETSLVYCGPA